MQPSAGVIAVYCFAFLILIVYTADTVVQYRRVKNLKYLIIQLCIIMAFFAAKVTLVILSLEDRKEPRQAKLHILQGLSLLQSLIIEVIYCSRMYAMPMNWAHHRQKSFPWLRLESYFAWSLSFIFIAAFIFGCLALVFICIGVYDQSSRVFVVTAVIIVHGFLAYFSICNLQKNIIKFGREHIAPLSILSFNLVSLLISLWVLLCSSITTFLLAETSISFISNFLWVSLTLYKLEIKPKLRNEAQISVANPSITQEDDFWQPSQGTTRSGSTSRSVNIRIISQESLFVANESDSKCIKLATVWE